MPTPLFGEIIENRGGFHVASDDPVDPHGDALISYCEARDRSRKLRAEWEELGSPATAMGGSTGKVLVEHPLLRAMRMAEAHESKLREVLKRRHPGPTPSGVLGIGLSASARLRAVNSKEEPPRIRLRSDATPVLLGAGETAVPHPFRRKNDSRLLKRRTRDG